MHSVQLQSRSLLTRLSNEGETPSGVLRFKRVTDSFPSLILPESQ